MDRTRTTLELSAFLIILILTGCPGSGNVPTTPPDYDVDISLWGYPDRVETYFVEIYMVSETDIVEAYEFRDVFTLFPFETTFTATPETIGFAFYISREEDFYEPDWTWFTYYDHTVDEITVEYWMNYHALIYDDNLSFGISHQMATPVSPGYSASLDFYVAPYYLLEFTDTSGVPSNLEITAVDGQVIVSVASSVSNLYSSDYTLQPNEIREEYNAWGFSSGTYYLLEPASYDAPCGVNFALRDVSVSEMAATLGVPVAVNFDHRPYQVLRYESMLNRALGVDFQVSGGAIDLEFGTNVADMMSQSVSGYTANHHELIGDWGSEELLVLLRPDGDASACSGSLTVSDIPYTPAAGEISAITACDNGSLVAAVDYDNRSLLLLDASGGTLQDTILLPYLNPSALCYSPPDNRLYIAYQGTGVVTPYNLATETLESAFVYSGLGGAEHITVEPDVAVRRLYVMGSAGFCVIDMDTGGLLGTSDAVGHAMAVDGVSEKLFVAYNVSLNDRHLRRYSIAGDVIVEPVEEQTASSYSSRYVVVLSPSKSRVVFPSQAGHVPDTHTNSLNPLDFTTVVDSWPINSLPVAVAFSPDESFVYFAPGSSDNMSIYVVDVTSDLVVRELPFPYSNGDALLAVTGDGNHVAGYSHEWMHGDYPRFYFFHDVRN